MKNTPTIAEAFKDYIDEIKAVPNSEPPTPSQILFAEPAYYRGYFEAVCAFKQLISRRCSAKELLDWNENVLSQIEARGLEYLNIQDSARN